MNYAVAADQWLGYRTENNHLISILRTSSKDLSGLCRRRKDLSRQPVLIAIICLGAALSAHAAVNAISIQAPRLSTGSTVLVTSPVHFEATAESDLQVTGYVVYVDGLNVYQSVGPWLDAWLPLPPDTTHSLYIKAWDSSGARRRTSTYSIRISGLAPPVPPATATRITNLVWPSNAHWTVDNNSDVGGLCNHGSLGSFTHDFDPNSQNAPDVFGNGRHLELHSECPYDDSLFYWKDTQFALPGSTNFLWDLWFYIPSSTISETVQAIEFDLMQAVALSDGVHEFMFGTQCHYPSNQWQLWLPRDGGLTWVGTGLSPCQFSTGVWHHITYFLQRVSASGYQKIPGRFQADSDPNNHLRFGTLTLDGKTIYLGGVSGSTIPRPAWSPVLGVHHQLDSAASGVAIEQYVTRESVTAW
jgi:hypothetical protein